MKKLNILKNIDLFIFNQLDSMIQSAEFQKVADAYASLEERAQEAVKIGLMIITFTIPLSILLIFWSINSSKKEEIQLKDKLINTANTLIQKQSILRTEERKILSMKFIDSQNSLKNTITSSLSSASIDSAKIQISDFQSEDLEGLITQVSAKLSFKGLTSSDIISLFNSLGSKLKIKLDEITIKKNDITNSLDGLIDIHYFSKNNSSEEEQ